MTQECEDEQVGGGEFGGFVSSVDWMYDEIFPAPFLVNRYGEDAKNNKSFDRREHKKDRRDTVLQELKVLYGRFSVTCWQEIVLQHNIPNAGCVLIQGLRPSMCTTSVFEGYFEGFEGRTHIRLLSHQMGKSRLRLIPGCFAALLTSPRSGYITIFFVKIEYIDSFIGGALYVHFANSCDFGFIYGIG